MHGFDAARRSSPTVHAARARTAASAGGGPAPRHVDAPPRGAGFREVTRQPRSRATAGWANDGQATRPRAGLVPPRPARFRSRGALPRAPAGARRSTARSSSIARSSTRCPRRADRRVEFIWASVGELATALAARGGALIVRHAHARRGDSAARRRARRAGRLRESRLRARRARPRRRRRARARRARHRVSHRKDQVIFERDEVLTQAGRPFSVFTPYKNAWLRALTPFHLQAYPVDRYADALAVPPPAATGPNSVARRRWASSAPTSRRWRRNRHARRRGALRRFPHAHRPLPGRAAISRPPRGRRICRCTCASARCRSASSPDTRTTGRWKRTATARPTWLSELDLARFLRADPVAPPARRRPRVQAGVRRAALSRRSRPASPPGATAAPGIRSSTPRCASSTRPATCTTGCG